VSQTIGVRRGEKRWEVRDFAHLAKAVRKGKVQGSDLVLRPESERWIPVTEIPELESDLRYADEVEASGCLTLMRGGIVMVLLGLALGLARLALGG